MRSWLATNHSRPPSETGREWGPARIGVSTQRRFRGSTRRAHGNLPVAARVAELLDSHGTLSLPE